MAGPRIVVVADAVELGRHGAEYVCTSLEGAIARRGGAHMALTGGSTAAILHRAIATPPFRDRVDWGRVDLWWGDDRFVPFDDADSNVRLARETLLGGGPPGSVGIEIPERNVHPFPIPEARAAGEGPEGCASRYAAELVARVPLDEHGLPVFDVVLLGVGPDGHFLSCFPGSPLVDAPAPPICAGVPAPTTASPHVPRVTCSPRLTEIAGGVLVMASGPSKAAIMTAVLAGPRDVHRYPSQIAARPGATWMLVRQAAAGLPEALRGAAG